MLHSPKTKGSDMNSQANSVHVVFGEVAYSHLRVVLPPNEIVLVQRDFLSFGRIQEIDSIEGWKSLRNYELNRLHGTKDNNFFNRPAELINEISILKKASTITLWSGTGLEDQLLKAFLIRLVELLGKDIASVRCHQFTTFKHNHEPVHTIGYLSFDDYVDLDKPIEVSAQRAKAYLKFWNEYTSNIPTILTSPENRNDSDDEIFNNAMSYLIRRFPNTYTGLNYWQSRLLIEAANTRSTIKILSKTLGLNAGCADFAHEAYLLYELRQLCEDPKLLQVTNNLPVINRGSRVKLTIKAKRVLYDFRKIPFRSDNKHWIGGISSDDIRNHWRADNSYSTLINI